MVAVGSSLGIVNEVFDKTAPPWFIPNGNRFDPRGFCSGSRSILSTFFKTRIIPFVDNYEEFEQRRNPVSKGLTGEVFKEEVTEIYHNCF
jgi:hypothetical protein